MTSSSSKIADTRVPGVWMLQGALVLAVVLLVAVWEVLTPRMLSLPPDVTTRVRLYPILLLPMVALFMAVNLLWLRPVYRDWPKLAAAELDVEKTSRLLRRVLRFPSLSFFMPLVGIISASFIVMAVQAAVHSTPLRIVVSLMLLACTHAVALALISFGIARLFMRYFLELPDLTPVESRREPDLRKRLALGTACTLAVAWAIAAVMAFDHQCRLAEALQVDPCSHPAIKGMLISLGLGGVAVAVLGGALGYLLARDFGRDSEAVTDGLERLTQAETAGAGDYLPVLSADEVGEMTESFNRLKDLLAEHNRRMCESAEFASKADDRQTAFFTAISHDLRTPLHSIIGFSQLLAEGDEGSLTESQLADIRTILKSGHYLLSLVDDVVDLSKIESGVMALRREGVDLATVVHEVLDVGTSLKRDAVVLEAELPDNLPLVYADETRLKQIILNLMSNALKFTERGSVLIRACMEGNDKVEILVEDSGPGIPEDKLRVVFDEFEQVRTTDAKEKMGTGLGLAISRSLVQLHQGQIRAENRTAGGSVFSFDLPVYHEQPDAVGEPGLPGMKLAAKSKPAALVKVDASRAAICDPGRQVKPPSSARTVVLAFAAVFLAGTGLLLADSLLTGLRLEDFPAPAEVVAGRLMIGLAVALGVVLVYLGWRLWPVGTLLGRLRRGQAALAAQRRRAALFAMQLPEGILVGAALVAVGTGLVLWFSGLLPSSWPRDAPLRQLFVVLASILLFGAVCYLALRYLMRPALAAFAVPSLPSRHRFGLRLRMMLWLAILAMVVVAPVLVLDASNASQLLSELSTRPVAIGGRLWGSDLKPLLSTHRLLALLLAVVFAAFVGWLLGQELRSPARAIGRRLDEIGTGSAAGSPARLPIHLATEIGRAAGAFNRLTAWLESEHRRLYQYAERVRKTARVRARFLANVSHELKTPLNSIIGFSDLLLRGYEGELTENQREDLEVINREGLVLLRLINDILLKARLESGKGFFHPEQITLAELLDKAAGELVGAAKSLRTLASEDDARASLRVDGAKLARALAIMIEHVAEGDTSRAVKLEAGMVDADNLSLRVTSPKHRLPPPDKRPGLLQGLRQISDTISTRQGGALGLSLVQLIAGLHDGEIGFVTSGDGQGLELRLPLPYSGGAEQV